MFTGRSSTSGLYDELVDADGVARPAAAAIVEALERLGPEELAERQRAAGVEIDAAGVTFTVYSDGVGIDRSWPFDVVPRVIARSEWDRIEAGLLQRLTALNHFIADVYGDQRILDAGLVPAEIVLGSRDFRAECVGVRPAHDVWAHICGSDLVRDADGTMYVLEDNLRVPSGVSYVLENRATTKRVFSELFANQSILPVDAYPERLRRILASLCPHRDDPVIAVLTPGIYNSAYFEHSFLARAMGIPLVEGRDMYVDERDRVMLRTVEGPVQVDVIYRRVDDLFLDPEVFRVDSTLGTPGLMRAWRAGNVALANAPGTGVADDKVVYSYVPDMIRFYLDEEALLANVPTFRCGRDEDRAHVLDHLAELVVKPANESGGYGIVIGPSASAEELEQCAAAITADPDNYVAQPVVSLSTVPTLCDGGLEPRHVDLRPFTVLGGESYVTCGGLTRVARAAGSLIVNSSQGGGSKDTWIVDTTVAPAVPGAVRPRPTAIDLTDPTHTAENPTHTAERE